MSAKSQKPVQEATVGTSTTHSDHLPNDLAIRNAPSGQEPGARLRAIHDLVRSGDYNVPAAAIADRMVERMIANRRRRHY
ncbi:MAG: hypothetical protein JW990_19805 [Thermoleophilia bacterium]|nr:hypothetical protein [Thermoleophilia bacterium]